MDLRTTGPPPTAAEIAAVDEVLGAPEADDGRVAHGGHAARSRRHLLLPVLHSLQDQVGWISRGGLEYACRRLTVPPAEAYGVASFYALFALEERPRHTVHVCDDIVCRLAGAEGRLAGRDNVQPSNCLGLCDRAPAELELDGGPPSAGATPLPQAGQPGLRLLRRVGRIDPESLDGYRQAGGYEALRRALEMGPEGVLRELAESGLAGRGGAAFPAGRKWEAVARAPVRPHYLVCNADESEPGTFKDRVLMEGDPFALVEAMTIAAVSTGCEQGYLYIRGEYPLARRRMENALGQARAHGLLGEDVLGRGHRFEVEVRRGAGAYICGEETALFNSIEGRRGEPRNKPPFPAQAGLFGKPTLVNNVETLFNVLEIVREGGAAFAAMGTPESTGTRLFCLSGHVQRPGVYEVPLGTTLRSLVDRAGLREGRTLSAVLLGGAAGSFVRPDQLDLELSFEATRAAGATLGSGAVIVLDDGADLEQVLLRIARFFRDESCGQCVPCRVGTARQEELVKRLIAGQPNGSLQEDIGLLADIAQAMRDASICGLGQTAASAVQSAVIQLGAFRR